MIDNLVVLLLYMIPIITIITIGTAIENYLHDRKEKKQNALDTQKRIQKIKMNELFTMIEEEYK